VKRIWTSRLAMWLRRSAIIGTAVCAGVTLEGSSFAGEPAAPAMVERKIEYFCNIHPLMVGTVVVR